MLRQSQLQDHGVDTTQPSFAGRAAGQSSPAAPGSIR
jgi:hypothetical protein